jgi:hypothetical protein
MKESIKKYFKVGTIQWMSHPPAQYDLLDSLKVLACDNFFARMSATREGGFLMR